MDRKQLKSELEAFKLACIKIGAICKDNTSVFEFDEVYQGVFIINIIVENQWLNQKYEVNALEELIELLYKNTTVKTRESILTLRLCKDAFPFNTVEYSTLSEGKTA